MIGTQTAGSFWHGSAKWMGSIIFVIVMSIACAGSVYRQRQLYLMRHRQQNNDDTSTVPAAPVGNPGSMPYRTQQPPQQPNEPRPYPVQTYSPVYPPASKGGAPPGNRYPTQAYPPPVQDPSEAPTQLPPVENTGPYPTLGGSAPYPTHQPGDAPTLNRPQRGDIQKGDLLAPLSYKDVFKR
ncbi:pollen-specific leucine-rich repeat extensin-like protein 4 [Lytechinus variegatus]|uniref:pollen-specific leucine-rich repeat extensin-like protein 4 n=1 Tax=Lytechinus variegatus TaxID=7654 RepID=UPI001BB23C5F|nr:pollen-specific leucine-rich repeat extensin-like protein 4 [Lytechinus variegatus]